MADKAQGKAPAGSSLRALSMFVVPIPALSGAPRLSVEHAGS
jgi:hypothetical protein